MVVKSPGTYMVFAVLCVLGLLVYANAIPHPFLHDDVVYIQLNPFIARWDNVLDVFVYPRLPFGQVQTPYYRPVLEIIYRLEFLFSGMNAWGFHLVNVLLHILNGWLVYLCACRLRLTRTWAFFLAALFLVHPVQTEAVACISGISNLAVAALMLWAWLMHVRGRARGRLVIGEALVVFLVALFTKEQAMVFGGVVLLYEILYRRETWRVKFRVMLPYALMTVSFWAWRAFLFPGFSAEIWANPYELQLRMLALARTLLMDLGLIVWPVDLHYYRSINVLAPYAAAWGILAVFVLVGAWGICRTAAHVRRGLLFGLGLALVMLLPGLNILPLINEYALILAAEHFLYLPLFGILLLAGVAGSAAGHGMPVYVRWAGVVLGVALIVVAGALTVRQNTFWRGEVVLFERTVRFEPGLGRVRMLLARAYAQEGHFSDAERQYTEALRIMENYVKRTAATRGQGASVTARDVYEQFVKAIREDRAQVRLMTGDLRGAAEDYRASLAHAASGSSKDNGHESALANNWGLALLQTGDRRGAREAFGLALRLNARQVQTMNNLGMMALERLDRATAKFWFTRAVSIAPGFLPAVENLKKVR